METHHLTGIVKKKLDSVGTGTCQIWLWCLGLAGGIN